MTDNKPHFWGTPYVALPLLLVLAFAVRFSYFYTPTIGWDESTFILFGQHILNGGLPYVDYFDIKPPLLFYFFAGAIKLFGATIPAVRVAGALCVFLAASACYFLGRHMWGKAAGLFAGILCISGMSVGNGMAVLSETVAVAPLMACAYLVIAWNRRGWAMFLAGALMGAAVLIRSNLAYTCLLSAPAILYLLYKNGSRLFGGALAYALGGIVVLLAALYPFYARDALMDVYRATVLAPMVSTGGGLSLRGLGGLISSWNAGWGILMVLSVCGIYLCLTQVRQVSPRSRSALIFIFSVIVATIASIVEGKTIHGHYLLQIIPMLSLFGGYSLYYLYENCGNLHVLVYALCLYITLLPLCPMRATAMQLIQVARGLDSDYSVVRSGESRTAAYIKEHLPEGRKIWVMDNHIIYWFLSMSPPSKYVLHPSLIALPDEITAASRGETSNVTAAEDIFRQRPYFIVRSTANWYVVDGTLVGDLINASMKRMYKKVVQFGDLIVYRIVDG
ncbi:ArnT family glycosyltransferase [Pseudodesulfovibrio karagichevae]|uniref:ArnT family glycosyltransferase n=1 Tax=Pseudodesulfovibrio karagichevae TaxID=3239305 RepID=A0ABV4K6S8_9BACT